MITAKRRIAMGLLAALAGLLPFAAAAAADDDAAFDDLRASLQVPSKYVQIGSPVLASLSIENHSPHAKTLTVPGAKPQIPSPEMGLPLSHVFSGGNGSGIVVKSENGRSWEMPVTYRGGNGAPILSLAPFSIVGTRVDLREFYPALRSPGIYRLTWEPYGGQLKSETVVIEIAPLKEAQIITDLGMMRVSFFYAAAPNHVANFTELAKEGFYSNQTFHRIEPGYMIMGGDPKGDGTGIRPDGKRLQPEFNNHPFEKGTVAMAIIEGDPNSASSQFFITNTRMEDWDGRYTVFGKLADDESMETLDRLMSVPVNNAGQPLQPVFIRGVRIVNAPANSSTPPSP